MKLLLSQTNLELLAKIAYFKIATTHQIAENLFFKDCSAMSEKERSNHFTNVANILRRLAAAGFVSRDWMEVLSTKAMPETRSKSAWFLTRKNFRTIRKEIEKTERADLWSLFEDASHEAKDQNRFAQNTLRHEIGITEMYMAIQWRTNGNDEIGMPFFLRTSPRHKNVEETVKCTLTSKKADKHGNYNQFDIQLPFNPDSVLCLSVGEGKAFFMIEFDNNTETLKEKLTNKFIAYESHRKQRLFGKKLSPWLNSFFSLGSDNADRAGYRVLFVTTNETRRNDLFEKSLPLETSSFIYCATLDDFTKDPLGNIWIRKKEFVPFLDEYRSMKKGQRSKFRAFRDKTISEMPRVSIP